MIENTILSHLVFNEEYARRVIPFLKDEYFKEEHEKLTFNLINTYMTTYNSLPTREAILVDLNNTSDIAESTAEHTQQLISALNAENTSIDWLIDNTRKFCKDRAFHNALIKCIELSEHEGQRGSSQQIMSDALSVDFETEIGLEYFGNAEDRFDYYNRKEFKVPFDIDYFNKITKGGVSENTLNILLGAVHSGKTMIMCHMATANLIMGKKVLYITLEMSEHEISKRIDTNLLNISFDTLDNMSKEEYMKKVKFVRSKTVGELVVKEFPTTTAGANNFRHLLNELRLKKNFVPDIIYIDYMNICSSSRVKRSNSVNSYDYIKAIAEELRGLSGEFGIPIWTATQTNRSGLNNSDIEMENTSDSTGGPMTADLFLAIIRTNDLDALGQIMFKQLKNRYAGIQKYKAFVVGVDLEKQRLYNVEQSAQTLTHQDAPPETMNKFGSKIKNVKDLF